MKRKISITIFLLLLLITLYFQNIVFAFIAHSEQIDTHMLSVMLQGRLHPTKTLQLGDDIILLPRGAGYVGPGSASTAYEEFLIPRSSWKEYQEALVAKGWTVFQQNGSAIKVQDGKGEHFNMSISPYTGFYFRLRYSD